MQDVCRMQRWVAFSCWFIAAVSLAGCWRGVSRQVLATVLGVEGEVVYQTDGKKTMPLVSDAHPGAGTILRTSNSGRADLALVPGALLEISDNAEVRIEELRLTKDGNETEDGMRARAARIRLNDGSITVAFDRKDESELRFAVATGPMTLTADEDCVCYLHVVGDKTRVTCARGKAYVSTGSSARAVVKAGYFQQWPGGALVSAADDARAQVDIAEALEAEQRLRQLQSKQINRRPF